MRQSVFEAHVGYWVLFSSLYEGVQSSSDALSDAPVTLAVSHVRSIQSYLKRSLAQVGCILFFDEQTKKTQTMEFAGTL